MKRINAVTPSGFNAFAIGHGLPLMILQLNRPRPLVVYEAKSCDETCLIFTHKFIIYRNRLRVITELDFLNRLQKSNIVQECVSLVEILVRHYVSHGIGSSSTPIRANRTHDSINPS